MGVIGISHVAVGVRDMDRALLFYRDLIGLEVTLDIEEGGFGPSREERRRAVYLRRPGATDPHDFFIVLDQQLTREPFGAAPRLFELGTHHFSFWVDDIEERIERIAAAGFKIIVAPNATDAKAYGEPAGSGRVATTLFKDDDGNVVQLDMRV